MNRERDFLASTLLLVFFLVTAVSLSGSLRLIDASKLIGVSPAIQPSVPTLQQPVLFTGGRSSASDSWILLALISLSLFAIIVFVRKKPFKGSDSSLWTLLGMLLALASYLGFFRLLSIIASLQAGGIQQGLVLATAITSLGLTLAVASLIALLALLERSRTFRTSAPLEGGASVQSVRRFLQSVRERIYSLPESEVYRDSVIACYSAMTSLLARYGAHDRPSLTPRELETSASLRLDVAETDIRLLTRLFEKARYARTPVSQREAQESADALERMTDQVVTRIGRVASI